MAIHKKTPPPTADSFEDPLSDYEQKPYGDLLEKILAEEHVDAIVSRPFATVPVNATVADALARFEENDTGCLIVERDGHPVGIFAEWDVLQKVAGDQEDLRAVRVGAVMTRNPVVVRETDSVAATLTVMALHGCRHVPVLSVDDVVVGVVNPRRLATFLEEKIAQA